MPNLRDIEFQDIINWFGLACFIIVVIVIFNSILDDFLFRIRYSFPQSSSISKTVIDTSKDPIQKNLQSPYKKVFMKGPDNGKDYTLTEIATYSISGMVVAKNTNFWFRGINRSDFDGIALMDVGLAWGDVADEKFIKKYMKFSSKKTLGSSRVLYTRLKSDEVLSWDYTWRHSSHTHLIPATQNVMSALLKMKKYKNIKLNGYLVDITYPDGRTAYTSVSRDDNNAGSRGMNIQGSAGGGACEIMYVTSVQLGEKVYK